MKLTLLLSIGFYDYDGSGTKIICDYARKYLDDGTVSFILFASESMTLIKIAQQYIPKNNLVLVEKNTIADKSEIRDSWEVSSIKTYI